MLALALTAGCPGPSGDPTSTDPGSTSSTADPTTGSTTPTTETPTGTATTMAGPTCTDGNVNEGEACDDGNSVNGDGCNNDCTMVPGEPLLLALLKRPAVLPGEMVSRHCERAAGGPTPSSGGVLRGCVALSRSRIASPRSRGRRCCPRGNAPSHSRRYCSLTLTSSAVAASRGKPLPQGQRRP